MDPLDWNDRCPQWLRAQHPHLNALIRTVTDGAELAVLATTVLDLLAQWGAVAPEVQRGFREAVRDRYRDLVQQQGVSR